MQSSPLAFQSREYQAQGTQVSCQADATPQAQRVSNTLKTGLTTASLSPRQAPAAAAPLLLAVPGLSVGVQCAPAAADGFAARAQPRVLGEVPGGAEFKSSSLLAREKEANPRKSQGSRLGPGLVLQGHLLATPARLSPGTGSPACHGSRGEAKA